MYGDSTQGVEQVVRESVMVSRKVQHQRWQESTSRTHWSTAVEETVQGASMVSKQ
jgi:hypothetical protein